MILIDNFPVRGMCKFTTRRIGEIFHHEQIKNYARFRLEQIIHLLILPTSTKLIIHQNLFRGVLDTAVFSSFFHRKLPKTSLTTDLMNDNKEVHDINLKSFSSKSRLRRGKMAYHA
jgi:hypothetical protein